MTFVLTLPLPPTPAAGEVSLPSGSAGGVSLPLPEAALPAAYDTTLSQPQCGKLREVSNEAAICNPRKLLLPHLGSQGNTPAH